MKPLVMLILDGAADVPRCAEYQKSPLAGANTPGLDSLSRNGHAGLIYPIAEGVEPETHTGVLNLLGYPVIPRQVPRGPIEALGCGLKVRDGALVLRVNFGTSNEKGLIVDRRVCRSLTLAEAETLCVDIVDHMQTAQTMYELDMRVVREYRACAVIQPLKGVALSAEISNTDPGYPTEGERKEADGAYEPVKSRPLDGTPGAQFAADLVNDFVSRAQRLLKTHRINLARTALGQPPANAILTRGPGSALSPMKPTVSDRFHARFTLLGDLPIELGVGILTGCECRQYESAGHPQATYDKLVPEILALVNPDAVVVVHIKGPDDYGHDRDFSGKVRSIEEIDKRLIEPLGRRLSASQCLILVTSDHATPCCLGVHSADKVPFVLAGEGVPHNGAARFAEEACATLNSPVRLGSELLNFAVDIARR